MGQSQQFLGGRAQRQARRRLRARQNRLKPREPFVAVRAQSNLPSAQQRSRRPGRVPPPPRPTGSRKAHRGEEWPRFNAQGSPPSRVPSGIECATSSRATQTGDGSYLELLEPNALAPPVSLAERDPGDEREAVGLVRGGLTLPDVVSAQGTAGSASPLHRKMTMMEKSKLAHAPQKSQTNRAIGWKCKSTIRRKLISS